MTERRLVEALRAGDEDAYVSLHDAYSAGVASLAVARGCSRIPPSQRRVIVLRDLQGWSAEETCDHLAIGEANQRVLLHRARTHVRAALDAYLDGDALPVAA